MRDETYPGELWIIEDAPDSNPAYWILRADPRVRVAKETLEGWFNGGKIEPGDTMKFQIQAGYIVYRVMGYDEKSREYLLAWPD